MFRNGGSKRRALKGAPGVRQDTRKASVWKRLNGLWHVEGLGGFRSPELLNQCIER
jgi:hypothetical protein